MLLTGMKVLFILLCPSLGIGLISHLNLLQHFYRSEPVDKTELNLYPVIGLLVVETKDQGTSNYTSFVQANYVKAIESGGARVVPVMINMPDEYYRGIFNVISGLVFPGGNIPFYSQKSGYGNAARFLYDLILKAKEKKNDEIPVLAVCMGFQMLLYLNAGGINRLVYCNAFDRADPLHLHPGYEQTELLGKAPEDVIQTLTTTNSTVNFHNYCATPKIFAELGIDKNLTLVSTSFNRNGLEYISTVEHKRLPIFGTQWHPEKNMFDFEFQSTPHSRQAVKAAQYIFNTFVDKARHNSHRYDDSDSALYPLIYNYQPTYDGRNLKYYFK